MDNGWHLTTVNEIPTAVNTHIFFKKSEGDSLVMQRSTTPHN